MNTKILTTLIEECSELIINGFSDQFDVTRTNIVKVRVWIPDEVEMDYPQLFSEVITEAIRKEEIDIRCESYSSERVYVITVY